MSYSIESQSQLYMGDIHTLVLKREWIARIINCMREKENFYLSSHRFQIYLFISSMEVGNKCKISSKITPAGPKKQRDMV